MSYCLPSGVSACMVADQAIFLDTGKDRYFSVSGRSAQAVRAVLEQRPIDAMDVEQLAKAGLIQVADGLPTNGRPPPAAPTRSLVEEAVGPATWGAGHLFEVAARLMRARHRVSRQPLALILDNLAASKADLAPAAPCTARVLAYAAKFNASRRFVPVRPRCLPDSLALLAGLARRGVTADLVFGVRLNPFNAHCWVQSGDIVLNDAVDNTTLHTPILVA